jgi:hypothetical protein
VILKKYRKNKDNSPNEKEFFEILKIGDPPENKRVYDVKMLQELLEERNKIKKPVEVIKVNKANLLEQIMEAIKNHNVKGVEKIWDESRQQYIIKF